MAEDTCEITEQIAQEEEEEEVDPGLQNLGYALVPPWFVQPSSGPISEAGNLLAGTTQAQIEADAAMITDEGTQVTTEEVAEMIEEHAPILGYEHSNRASTAANIARELGEDIRPGLPGTDILLEDDLTLTPVVTNLFSAEKSTWVFSNGTIVGEGTQNIDIETIKFKSKPKELLAFSPLYRPYSFPSNIPNVLPQVGNGNLDVFDNVRWVSDKIWFNAGHVSGPHEYTSIDDAKAYHAARGADLYFINRRQGLGRYQWGMFYFDAKKRAYLSLVDESKLYSVPASDPSKWRFYDQAKNEPSLRNNLGFKVKNEVYVIECEANRGDNWKWSDYFYGHVPEQILEDMGIMRDRPDQLFIRNARRSATTVGNPLHWRNMYTVPHYREVAEGKSLNLFPVIPFYGDNRFFQQNSTEPITVAPAEGVVYTGKKVFVDYSTNVTDLLTKEESDFVDVGSDAYFDIRPVYSYYDCLYENIITPVVSELELPSPYQGATLMKALSNSRKEGVSTFLPEDFDEVRFSRLLAADRFYDLTILSDATPSDISSYELQNEQFRLIQNMMDGSTESQRAFVEHMAEYYGLNPGNEEKDILLSAIPRETLDDLYEQRYMNPMFVEMEFGKIKRSQVASALTSDGGDVIITDLMNTLSNRPSSESFASYVDQAIQTSLNQTAEVIPGDLIRHSDTIPMKTRMIDISDWWASFFKRATEDPEQSPVDKFATIFRLLKMKMKISNFVNNHARSYDQIMNGVPAKSEVMGFMIQKFKDEELISNFYIMSDNDREVEKFVDSQVKYGEVYEYRINRIVAIVGNRYTYHNCVSNFARAYEISREENSSTGQFDMPFGIRNQPCLRIGIIPTTQKRVVVVDSPPVFPDVEVIPFKNVSDKIMFTLRPNGGEYLSPPVILEEEDRMRYVNVALSQGLIDVEGDLDFESMQDQLLNDPANVKMIKHKSDDPTKTFQVFRTDEYPEKIGSFYDKKIATIESTADNATFLDRISPNVKYYYVFRCIDIHNKVSNPGFIHEIELIKINEAVRLSHKIVNAADLEALKTAKQQSTIDVRQFLMLRPNFDQKTLNLGTGKFSDWKRGLDSQSFIGDNTKEKLWKKRFKIRIRSKDTGKEIDIDVTFNLKLSEDQENKKVNLIC